MSAVAVWVVPVSNLAGVARHVLDVARVGLPGYELQVAAPSGPLVQELRGLGVVTHELPLDGPPRRAVQALRALVRQVRPRVVHSHLARADFLVVAAAAGLPVHLVSTEHGIASDSRLYHGGRAKAAVRRVLHRLRVRRFSALIAVSRSTQQEMVRAWRPPRPVQVIHNGVDPSGPPPRLPGHRFLTLSRLAPEKGLAATLEAFAAIAARETGATLTIAGDGPDRDALTAHAARLGLGDRVSFPGHLHPEAALASHDVLLQLSVWENASYSILDAVTHGLGVVATPVGGNPEILPAHCMVDSADIPRVADVMQEQATLPARRPSLPERWPTVASMAQQIADSYDRLPR
ncbi:glycosyltransferase family 4 protein [Tessaracoccus sp. MC1679]|uniref:glycosyltransferase family 4 protein n=1 Tax=Tessaracoccus sp. MC1679 TaxID=2760313 RepID=UPI001600BE84|nr:glycosyltransferase family 4 protein [Tessaracoccus sp. MC1679]